jgi:hypothetical protein
MVEIFDGMLQFLEHVLLALAVAGNVGNRPHRVFRLALAGAERPDPHPQPAAVAAFGAGAGDADFFLLPLAFARRLEQAEHRFGDIGIADEDPFHRTGVERGRRPRQRQVGGVGIDHVTAGVGDGESVMGMIGDPAHDGVVRGPIGETDDACGEREQIEQPDHRQQRQQPQNIGLRLRAAEGHQRDRHRDDPKRHQQHQHDAAAASRRLVGGERLA